MGAVLRVVASATAASLLFAPPLSGQTLEGGMLMQSYTFDDPTITGVESVHLFTRPFSVTVPVVPGVAVTASGALARGTARSPSEPEVTLSGPTDTYLGVSARAGYDWLVVTARTVLPTGSTGHSSTESLVAGIVAAELLPFAIKTWGSGGSIGGNVAAFRKVAGWGVGVTAGYDVASEYEPLAEQFLVYRPGDQMRLSVTVDHDLGASGTFSAMVGFESFGNDQLSGNELFQSGNRVEGVVSYAFALGRTGGALAYGGVSHRSRGTLLLRTPELPSATDAPSQRLYRLGMNMWVPMGRRVRLHPTAETRVFSASDGASQGWVMTAGSALEWRVAGTPTGRRFVLTPSTRLRLGKVIVSRGVEVGLSGWEAGVTFGVVVGS